MYRRCLVFATAAALVVAGCEDSSAPTGSASTVAIRAFVDADGSGAFGAGDVPIAGLNVTLQEATSGEPSFSATTDAQGLASFPDVPPGSYAAAFLGNAPAGAVLATAQIPVVVAPFSGAQLTGEFRFVYLPGSINGVLYRDNNANNVYDPGVDTPAPGLPVTLLRATGTEQVASTTTSAAGAFSFRLLRPGAYRVAVTPLPTMQIVGGDTMAVTVAAQNPLALPVRFTGNLLSPIAAVRAQPAGSVVAFEGVATVGVGIFSTSTTGNQFNVQDASGAGILILQVPLASGIQAGDSVRVVGTTQVSAGELVVTTNPTITRLAQGRPLPGPRVITGAQVAASTASDPLQGLLVKVSGVLIDSVQTTTSSSYNVYASDGGANKFIIRVGTAAVGIARSYWLPGRTYDVTGLLGNFNGPQLKVRSPADVTVTTVISIAAAKAEAAGDTVTVQGIVTAPVGIFGSATGSSTNAYIADATGGIQIFGVPATPTLEIGDLVRVTGIMGAFSGELELMRFSSTSLLQITELGTGPAPTPRIVTGAQVAARTYEGELVKLPAVTVTAVTTPTSSGGYNVTVTAADGTQVIVRHDRTAVGIPASFFEVGAVYDVTGILTAFNSSPQLKVRGPADVVRK